MYCNSTAFRTDIIEELRAKVFNDMVAAINTADQVGMVVRN
jgi:hypothetical protein